MTASLAVQQSTVVAPVPGDNRVDKAGRRSGPARASQILASHKAGLLSRRQHDLLSEKLLLHIDASGDFQWAEIWNDQKIVIPRLLSEYRKTENLLRLVVDNAVAHHTTMPLRYFADTQPDRRSRDKALVDALFANHVAEQQDLNGLFSDALYMAMATGFCFDSETEVLTKNGFKLFKDVDIDADRIASLDPTTGRLTYAKAVAKQELPYDGLMFHWSTRYVDLMVTPEHRMLVYQRQREVAKVGGATEEWIPPYRNGDPEKRSGELRFVSAFDAAHQGEIWVRKDAVWKGEEPETFTFPDPTGSKYGRRPENTVSTIDVEDYLRFMGWYLSEGHCDYSPPRRYTVVLTQKDGATRAELAELLARVTGGSPYNNGKRVKVSSKQLCEYLQQFGRSWEKFVPSEIKAMSPRLIRVFLDALFRGDGSVRDGRWTAYYTSSLRLMDDVQELLLKVGLSWSARIRDGGTDCGDVNGVRIKVRRDCYELSVNHDNLRPQVVGEPGVVAYKGTVWDLTVPPNGTLFVRRRGKVVWSGNCPVHRYWRYDRVDQYEPITYGEPSAEEVVRQVVEPQAGMIDCFVGNPFDTVFDRAAKRGSIHWCSYGRMLPAELVRATFPEAEKLEGSKRLPSASIFQRIARSWNLDGLGVHGSPVIQNRQNAEEGEELLLVICRETLPGWDADWPEGRLEIIGVPGEADLRLGQGGGHAVLLADQPLPASDFSFSLFYSHHRGDDVLGKPWVEDIDQLQVDLNIAISKKWEYLNRGIEAPIVAPGGALDEDMLTVGQYDVMEIEPSLASWRPRAMEWPAYILQGLEKEAEDKRRAIYTGGGYQASSRGEAPGSRMAYRAILALQQADNTIHGPVNMRFRRSGTDFMAGCWRQMKAYGDVPWMVSVVGDEYEHLVEPWVDSTKLSDAAPKYKLVNAFGASPELRAQEVLELAQTRGADGKPFITTEEARRAYPNAMVFGADSYPGAVAKRRAKAVIAAITHAAQQFRDQTGFTEQNIAHPWVQRAAMIVFGQMEANYPRLRDDDLQAHIAALSEITQDETADPVARLAAMRRQDLYFLWQASMAGMPTPQRGSLGAQGPAKKSELDPRVIAAQMQGAGGGAGAVLQNEESGPSPIAATARG